MAAQKKIQAAHTRRLCSPPPPTRVASASTASAAMPEETDQIATKETEAAKTLLSLSMDTIQTGTGEITLPAKEAETASKTDIIDTEQDVVDKPPVAFEVNVNINPTNNEVKILPGDILGSAIKEEPKPTPLKSSCRPKTGKATHFRMKKL